MNKKLPAAGLLLLGLIVGSSAMGCGSSDLAPSKAAAATPATENDDEERIVEGRQVDPNAAPMAVPESRIPEDLRAGVARAAAHLKSLRRSGISIDRDLRMRRVGRHENGTTRAVYQQYHHGIPVFGGMTMIETDASGKVTQVQDKLVEGLHVDTSPKLTEQEAAAVALKTVPCSECRADALPADLWVMRHESSERLVYGVKVPLGGQMTRDALRSVFVDATSGDVVWSCSQKDDELCLSHP